jgi:ribosomal peptide maturation radical SAM protein 1
MSVALVAMPWATSSRPSAALASLAPFVRAHGHEVEPVYAYLDAALAVGGPLYGYFEDRAHREGELLYAALLYPERRAAVVDFVAAALAELGDAMDDTPCPTEIYGSLRTWRTVAGRLLRILAAHLEATAQRLAGRHQVVGMTTCFGQLCANLCLARRLKELDPALAIVLGGSSISSEAGVTVLREYPWLDYVIQGEGELPLTALLDHLVRGESPDTLGKGVLSRKNLERFPRGVPLWEVPNLDDLPLPDYDAFAEAANRAGLAWLLPIEGSRGCWWDRGKRTGNPKDTCYFCNLNVQWQGYREKSLERLVREVDQCTTKYSNTAIFFLDNIIRTKGVEELGERLAALNKDLVLFYELRANIHPHELLCLWEAGLEAVQFGIEALSTSLLRRIGKGTTAIKNLQAMKVCHELRIDNLANLILDFPGSTAEEVEETCRTIRDYAFAYQPLRSVYFMPSLDNTVDFMKSHFGIENPRNADHWRVGMPGDVYQRLVLMERSAEYPHADWQPVPQAVAAWRRARAALRSSDEGASENRHLLFYLDGGAATRVYRTDPGSGQQRCVAVLEGLERAVYMHCHEIRDEKDVVRACSDGTDAAAVRVAAVLSDLAARKLVFEERGKYLSIAPAHTPELAARRIRAAHRRDLARRSSEPAPRALPVLG